MRRELRTCTHVRVPAIAPVRTSPPNGCHWRTALVAASGPVGSRQQSRTHCTPLPRPAFVMPVGTPWPRQADACTTSRHAPVTSNGNSVKQCPSQQHLSRDLQAPLRLAAEVTKHTAIGVVQAVTAVYVQRFGRSGPCRVALTPAHTTLASSCTLRTRQTKGASAWILATQNGGELVRG